MRFGFYFKGRILVGKIVEIIIVCWIVKVGEEFGGCGWVGYVD